MRIAVDADATQVSESKRARALVINRERRLKGPLARVENKRAQELWQGASSAGRLQYPWVTPPSLSKTSFKRFMGLRMLEPHGRTLLFDILKNRPRITHWMSQLRLRSLSIF